MADNREWSHGKEVSLIKPSGLVRHIHDHENRRGKLPHDSVIPNWVSPHNA